MIIKKACLTNFTIWSTITNKVPFAWPSPITPNIQVSKVNILFTQVQEFRSIVNCYLITTFTNYPLFLSINHYYRSIQCNSYKSSTAYMTWLQESRLNKGNMIIVHHYENIENIYTGLCPWFLTQSS